MFQNSFVFEGRIRRTEYGLSVIICTIIHLTLSVIIAASDGQAALLAFAYVPMQWFFWAQGAKRSHDIGKSGWWQLVPFFGLWLAFEEGNVGPNQYGADPKYRNPSPTTSSSPSASHKPQEYPSSGKYIGGHNAPQNQGSPANTISTKPANGNTEYQGKLYN